MEKVRVLFLHHHLLQQTVLECTAALNSMRDGPWATGLAAVMEAVLTGISGMLFVYFPLSVLWLSILRGVRCCGGHHGLGSRLGLPGLFVFSLLLLGVIIRCRND